MRFDSPFYVIEGFTPPLDKEHWAGGWGFRVKLEGDFVIRCLEYELKDRDVLKGIEKSCGEIVQALFDYDTTGYPRFRFHKETLLLTNMSVPGNACGLDLSGPMGSHWTDDRMDVDRPGTFPSLIPHNVDGMHQAVALLSCFLEWARFAGARVSDE